jgi:hypothetical protein
MPVDWVLTDMKRWGWSALKEFPLHWESRPGLGKELDDALERVSVHQEPPLSASATALSPEQIAHLREVADKADLSRVRARIVSLLCDKGGEVPIAEINAIGSWNTARAELNKNPLLSRWKFVKEYRRGVPHAVAIPPAHLRAPKNQN